MANTWQLQEAKDQLSRVVENALSEGVQIITRHGEPSVVVLSVAEYKKLKAKRKSLVQMLRSCPVSDFSPKPLRDTPTRRPL